MAKQMRGICAICGKESKGLTRDHIPPSAIYPEGLIWKGRPIIVRTCSDCNHGSSGLDTEFGVMMNWIAQHPLDALDSPQWLKLKSMLDGQKKLKWDFLNAAEPVELISEGGVSLGPGAIIRRNMAPMIPLIQKMVRGLHFKHTGKVIPMNHDILVKPLDFSGLNPPPAAGMVEQMRMIANYCPPLEIENSDIFDYRFAIAEDRPEASAWILVFRGKLVMMCFVGPLLSEAIEGRETSSDLG